MKPGAGVQRKARQSPANTTLNGNTYWGRSQRGGVRRDWNLHTKDREEAALRVAADLAALAEGRPLNVWRPVPRLRKAPPYMRWSKGAKAADGELLSLGRRKGDQRVLFAQILLPRGGWYTANLLTDDEAIAARRMVSVVAALVDAGRLSPKSGAGKMYGPVGAAGPESERESPPARRSPRKAARSAPAPRSAAREAGRPVSSAEDCFRWQEAVLAATGLSHARKSVASRLARYRNNKTGLCNPSVPTIARKTGLKSERGVEKALRALEAGGWILTKQISGRSSEYTLTLPPNAGAGVSKGAPPNGEAATPEPSASNPRTAVRANRENKFNTPRERATALPAGALARAPAPKPPTVSRDRGTQERDLAKRLGDDGWELLHWLPEDEVERLCAQQRTGSLSDAAIAELRVRYAEAQR